jgi:hypothetical protein
MRQSATAHALDRIAASQVLLALTMDTASCFPASPKTL